LRLALIGGAALCIIVAALGDKPLANLAGPEPITVTAMPIEFDREQPDRTHFGKLIWRSTLALYANSDEFGGYSALAIDPTGTRLIAISDAGSWLRATLDYDGHFLKGLSRVTIGPLLGKDGKPLEALHERDSEGFTLSSGTIDKGDGYISFERDHRIEHYSFTETRFGPPDRRVALPPDTRKMPSNSGLEAIVKIRSGPEKGAILAFAEYLHDTNGNLEGWIIGGAHPGAVALTDIGGFSVTDVATLPNGDVALLERRFRYVEGIKMRIRLIRAAAIRPGAVIKGEVLLSADDRYNIDNMEAIGAYRSAGGETVLTLMSDDNFSPLQRTLIMQFVLPDAVLAEASGHSRPRH
jgi:hypothetical protein